MEPVKESVRFVLYTEIEDAYETAFLPQGMNEFFFCRGHPFKKGDHIRIVIQKWPPDADPDHNNQT